MPPFDASPFAHVPLALPGWPVWVFGTAVNTLSPTRFLIRQWRADGDDATVTGTIVSGGMPDPDDRISILGSAQHELNVVNARIQDLDINPLTGFGTITFELAHFFNRPLWNEGGTALIIRDPDDEIVSVNQPSIAVCIPDSPEGRSVQGFSAQVTWPAGAVGGAVAVQGADIYADSAFSTVGTITFPSSRYDTPAGVSANFVRLMVTTASGDGSLTGRILVR